MAHTSLEKFNNELSACKSKRPVLCHCELEVLILLVLKEIYSHVQTYSLNTTNFHSYNYLSKTLIFVKKKQNTPNSKQINTKLNLLRNPINLRGYLDASLVPSGQSIIQ